MPKKKPRVPQLRPKKVGGHVYAVAKFNRRERSFGRWDDPQSVLRFHAYLSRWEANGRQPVNEVDAEPRLTIRDLQQKFMQHAHLHYRRKDGTPTREALNFEQALRHVVDVCGDESVDHFESTRLEDVRESMLRPTTRCPEGLARNTVNARVRRIKHVFRWGRRQRLVPASVVADVSDVEPLLEGRSRARETDEVPPVPLPDVEATIPHVSGPVAGLIWLQWFSGMRPGEAVALRPADINTQPCDIPLVIQQLAPQQPIWVYEPLRHKNEWRRVRRRVFLLPEAQEALRPFLLRIPKPDPTAPLFSPRLARKARRRSPAKAPSARCPGEAYSVTTYGHAIHRAVCAANAQRVRECIRETVAPFAREEGAIRLRIAVHNIVNKNDGSLELSLVALDQALRKVVREARMADATSAVVAATPEIPLVSMWSPNQLRHACGTRMRQPHGADAAQVMLGHRSVTTTERYARADATAQWLSDAQALSR